VWFDTTVAVVAENEKAAAEKALKGSHWDPSRWYFPHSFEEDPVVSSVEEEMDWSELEYADQTHLLPAGYFRLREDVP
jgi:hypothetical protein